MAVNHRRYMRSALREASKARARGNPGVGSVVVRDNRIVARGHNEADSRQDVTAHAETVVMRKLSKKFGAVSIDRAANRERLGPCTLYTTVEPCPMCAWALCMGGISAVVIGARHSDLGRQLGEYRIERLFELTGHAIAVESGVLAEECAALRR